MARRGENIRKRSDGRWEGRYMKQTNGENRYHSVYAKSYLEVKEKLLTAKMKQEKQEKTKDGEQDEIFFGTIADEWLGRIRDTKKQSTYVKYSMIYNTYLSKTLAGSLVSRIDTGTLHNQICFSQSESIQKSICCVLNQILSYGEENYNVPKIQVKKKNLQKKKEVTKILNLAEQASLIRFLYQDMDIHKLGILICLSMGLRLGEICALKWRDINMELKLLSVNSTIQRIRVEDGNAKTKLVESSPKTECSRREIPIPGQLAKLIAGYVGKEGYFLGGVKPMEPRTYQNKFKFYLKEAGLKDYNFHILRHTFATNCIDNGADIKSISEMLGHSDVKITLNRYVHPSVDTKRCHMDSLFSFYGQYMGQPERKSP